MTKSLVDVTLDLVHISVNLNDYFTKIFYDRTTLNCSRIVLLKFPPAHFAPVAS
jgi:hypothetical protein